MSPEKLVKYAIEAQGNAKAKYSKFYVGCALLASDNQVFLGCNIESAAYPSTMCAERVAIYSAISQGVTDFKAIAIVSGLANVEPLKTWFRRLLKKCLNWTIHLKLNGI